FQYTLDIMDTIYTIIYSPDGGHLLIAGADESPRILDVTTGEEVSRLEGHRENTGNIRFSRDGRFIVTGSADRTMRVWDAETGMELSLNAEHTAGVEEIEISSDGTRVASTSWDTLIIWTPALDK
ncbi:MAG TPA: hypothetical protein VJZ27_16825, partial [Aggregatilineales bacterium]|nr:hypothetical protein [Aggregatilineales bacterium]